jgi:hypothetical protein
MDYKEAFLHFWENNCPKPIPHEIRQTKLDLANNIARSPRVEKILNKYAPGKYIRTDTFTLVEPPANPPEE